MSNSKKVIKVDEAHFKIIDGQRHGSDFWKTQGYTTTPSNVVFQVDFQTGFGGHTYRTLLL